MASGLLAVAAVGLRLKPDARFRADVVKAMSEAGDQAGAKLGDSATRAAGDSFKRGRSTFTRSGQDAGRTFGEGLRSESARSFRDAAADSDKAGQESARRFRVGFDRGAAGFSGIRERISAEGSAGAARFGASLRRGALSGTAGFIDLLGSAGQRGGSALASGLTRTIGGTVSIAAGVGRRAAAAFGGALRAGTVAFGLLTAAGVSFGLKTVASLESSQIAFETFIGSAKEAAKFTKQLQKVAASTPFEFTDLTALAQRLLAAGFAVRDVVPTITAIGDAVAGLGGSPELLGQVSNAIAQIQVKGKLSNEELLQLSEAGVPAVRILADAFGYSTEKLQKLASEGKITAADAIPKLVEGIEKGTKSVRGFGGLMEKQSATLSGLFSTLKDTVGQALANLITPYLPQIKQGLTAVIGLVGTAGAAAAKKLSENKAEVLQFGRDLASFGKSALVGVAAFVTYLIEHRRDIASFGLSLVAMAAQGGSALLRLAATGLSGLSDLFLGFRDLTTVVLSTFSTIIGYAATAFSWVPGVGRRLGDAKKALDGFKTSAVDALTTAANRASVASGNLSDTADSLDGVARKAGAAKTAIGNLPKTVKITATSSTNSAEQSLRILTRDRFVTIRATVEGGGTGSRGVRMLASGGVARGGPGGGELAIVGEEGPELAILPGGTRVIDAATTAAARNGAASAPRPLGTSGGLTDSDRAMIAALADRPVVVQVDGREIARVVNRRNRLDALR